MQTMIPFIATFIVLGLLGNVQARLLEDVSLANSDLGASGTEPLDLSLRNGSLPLPSYDPRLVRKVEGIAPEQISITYWGPGKYLISYVTGDAQVSPSPAPATTPNSTIPSAVRYGTKPGQPSSHAAGKAITYTYDYSPYGGLSYASAVIHHVLLTGLQPATRYFYQVGIESNNGLSEEHNFTTLPGASSFSGLKIAVMADIGQTANTTQMLGHLKASKPDIIFNIADFSYANTHYTDGAPQPQILQQEPPYTGPPISYQPRWDYWGRMMEGILSHTPLLHIQGNHEIESQPDSTTFLAYNSRWPVPQSDDILKSTAPNSNDPLAKACFAEVHGNPKWTIDRTGGCANGISANTNNMYYSVDMPGAHTIWLSSYIPGDDFSHNSEQYRWLEADLAKVDCSKTPWLIVNWHAPWYSSYESHFKENECMRQSYEPLLYKHGVDVVFTGHVHAYERTHPVYNNSLDECGPTYITIGDGGNSERLSTTFIDTALPAPPFCVDPMSRVFPGYQPQRCFSFNGPNHSYCYTKQPAWSAFREPSFGFGTFTILSDTQAHWQWHRNQNSMKHVADEVLLARVPGHCHPKPA